MSTILKALRRLEHEKSSHTERPLREQVVNAPESKRGVSMALAVGGTFAAGLALGAAALILWPRPDAVVAAVQAPAAVAAGPESDATQAGARDLIAAAPETSPVPVVERAPNLPRQAFESPVAVVERKARPGEEPTVIELTATPPGDGPPPEGVRPAAEAMKPRPRFRPQPRIRPPPTVALTRTPEPSGPATSADLPEGVRVAFPDRPAPPPPESPAGVAPSPATKVATAVPRSARTLPEITPKIAMPPTALPVPTAAPRPNAEAAPEAATAPPPAPIQVAREKPVKPPVSIAASASAPSMASVQVARTHWHPTPEKRIAIVEVAGRPAPIELHEGDRVGSLVVGTIEPSGVVFLRDGVEVRKPIGAGH
jgi:hypothetical protein